jgi:hypothetical protein
MKFSRKIGRSSHHNSTSISRRKKKKSNEKNSLGKSGKRSRGHKRVKTYKRVKIFHKGGAHKIETEYDAGLVEYKKISRFSLFNKFNNNKTSKFKVSISVSTSWVVRETTMRYDIKITLKTRNETGNETTMTLVLPIYKYDNIYNFKIHDYLFKSNKDEYTFDFPRNSSFFDEIIAKSNDLLNKFKEEQKKLEEEEKLIKRIKEITNKLHMMERAYYLFQSHSYNSITYTLRMQNAVTEYELFKKDQKTLADKEKALIEASTKYTDIEKNNRKLLVDAVLNRILRTQSLLMITSHLFSEYNLHKNEVMDVIELLKEQDPNYNLRHFPPGAIRRSFTNDPPYDLVHLLGFIEERIPKIQDKEEEQKGAVKNMIEQMTKIHSQRGANELKYDIIKDEVIGNGSNGVWGRYQWWSVKDLDVIFIEPW